MINEPLYCYKFDEKTCKMEKIVVTDYEIVKTNFSSKVRYKICGYQIHKTQKIFWLEDVKLDRYVSGKVFTFVEDDNRAFQIVLDAVLKRVFEHRKCMVNAMELYNKVKKAKCGL
jgi:hypothetical protein